MPETEVPAVRLAGVRRSYDGKAALGPIDLDVPARRTLALVGPSGCGKSTLLRLVIGLLAPDAGTVEALGTPVTAQTRAALRLRMGYVIQEGALFPHLTAAENVALVARDQGWTAERITQRINDLAALSHLPHELLGRFPAQLSGGQRQRVALMRALVLDPDLLLLDEPLGALDPMIRARLQEELAGLFRTLEKTVLFVTHDMAEAAFFAHEIVLLKDGRIVQRGSAADLAQRPSDPFVTEFLGAQRKTDFAGMGR
jgi:osmoprotectant transport system ATP-binding protein